MKVFSTMLLLAACSFCVRAQLLAPADQNPPGVAVTGFSWRKERINWERDPFGGAVESAAEMRVRSRNERRIDEAKTGGNKAEVERLKREAGTDAAISASNHRDRGPARYAFTYRASVRNDGEKAIKVIDWDYVFYDASTHKEVGRRQFTSEEKVSTGSRRDLAYTILTPPSATVSVSALGGEKERNALSGEVILMRIVYADGTVWQRPQP
jgi:hypothetical protein